MRDEILTIIQQFVGQTNMIVVPRIMVKFCKGDAACAIMLSQIIYWSDRATLADGWFYKSKREWEEELGLSARILDRCQRDLVEMGVIETCLAGLPAVTHYRLTEQFVQLFAAFVAQTSLPQTSKLAATSTQEQVSTNGGIIHTEPTAELTHKPTADSAGAQTLFADDVIVENKPQQPVTASPEKPLTAQQAMVKALSEVCKMDPKMSSHASRLGKVATELVKAEYVPDDIARFTAWWLADEWRAKNTPVPSLAQVQDKIAQCKAFAALTGNGNGAHAASRASPASPPTSERPDPPAHVRLRELRQQEAAKGGVQVREA